MVKKIKAIEDDNPSDLDRDEYQAKMLEYQQAIDWKLWEMLKILQAWAEREGLNKEEAPAPKANDAKRKSTVKPVIVDEDE